MAKDKKKKVGTIIFTVVIVLIAIVGILALILNNILIYDYNYK